MKCFYLAPLLLFFSGCGPHNPLPGDPITRYTAAPIKKVMRPAPVVKEANEDTAPDKIQSTRALVQSVKREGRCVLFVLNERVAHGTWPKRTYYHPIYTVREDELVDEAGRKFMISFQDYLLVQWYEKDGKRLVWSVRVLRKGRSRR